MPSRRARAALAALAAAWLTGCAAAPGAPGTVAFAVMGDTPYNDREEVAFLDMLRRIDREALDFAVHVGDFKSGGACSDALYAKRRAQFDAVRHPFAFVPGDNEWVDCDGDPQERLARLREVFFAERFLLGGRRFAVEAQDACLAPPAPGCGCGAHPENRAWEIAGVRFVTLNVAGSDDNTGRDARNDLEARCRGEANRRWLEAAVAAAAPARALVVMIQANPWQGGTRGAYDRFLAQLAEAGRRLARPVLLVHGDTHSFRVDYPFPHVTRLETWGSPFVGWVKVTWDAAANTFRIEPQRMALVLPR